MKIGVATETRWYATTISCGSFERLFCLILFVCSFVPFYFCFCRCVASLWHRSFYRVVLNSTHDKPHPVISAWRAPWDRCTMNQTNAAAHVASHYSRFAFVCVSACRQLGIFSNDMTLLHRLSCRLIIMKCNRLEQKWQPPTTRTRKNDVMTVVLEESTERGRSDATNSRSVTQSLLINCVHCEMLAPMHCSPNQGTTSVS